MAAGLGFKTFQTGEVLTAADTNGYLMQGVLVFANAAARDAAITSPQEGQCCYLKDTDAVLTYSGTAWVGFDDSNAIQNAIINAKGDLIAGSANDTPAILSAGANGETLVADSSATTGLRWTATPSASNPVLNSSFQVWQRGTSISLAASTGYTSGYTADRWQTQTNANQACTISRQATGDTTNLPNIQYNLRYQRNSGQTGTSTLTIMQNFESVNSVPFAGKTITFSFYARAGANFSPTSSALPVVLWTGTGTDQNVFGGFTGQAATISQTATLTTTWQRFQYSATLPTNTSQISVGFQMTPTGTAGAADYFDLTGVQIDVGSVALPFRTYSATLAGELAACQRYYWRSTAGTTYNSYAMGQNYSTTQALIHIPNPVEMRTAATSIEYSALGVTNSTATPQAVTSLVIDYKSPLTNNCSATVASGLVAGNASVLTANANAAAYLAFSAEL